MALLEGQPEDRRAGDPLDEGRHALHAAFRLRGPADGLLGLDVELGYLDPCRQQDVARRVAKQILGVAAERLFSLTAVDAGAPDDQQPRLGLSRVVEDLLE